MSQQLHNDRYDDDGDEDDDAAADDDGQQMQDRQFTLLLIR